MSVPSKDSIGGGMLVYSHRDAGELAKFKMTSKSLSAKTRGRGGEVKTLLLLWARARIHVMLNLIWSMATAIPATGPQKVAWEKLFSSPDE